MNLCLSWCLACQSMLWPTNQCMSTIQVALFRFCYLWCLWCKRFHNAIDQLFVDFKQIVAATIMSFSRLQHRSTACGDNFTSSNLIHGPKLCRNKENYGEKRIFFLCVIANQFIRRDVNCFLYFDSVIKKFFFLFFYCFAKRFAGIPSLNHLSFYRRPLKFV